MASLVGMLPAFLTKYEEDADIYKIIGFYFVVSLAFHFFSGVVSSITLPHYNE